MTYALARIKTADMAVRNHRPKPHSIHILTHILRSGPEDGEPDKGPYGPLYTCHVDQSAWAAEGVARRWIKDDVEALLKLPRYQIINVGSLFPRGKKSLFRKPNKRAFTKANSENPAP